MEGLPADVLYEISGFFSGKDMSIKDKINNIKQINDLCKVNKRFNQIYCQNDRIWKDLWRRDISSKLPDGNIKINYLSALNKINKENIDEILVESVKLGYDQAAKNALANGANINVSNNNPVNMAISFGHLELLQYLLSNGGKFIEDIYAGNALGGASTRGNLNTISYILDRYSISQGTLNDMLDIAVRNHHFKLADYLINKGANINDNNDFILRFSTIDGNLSAVKYAVEHGANIHANNDEALRSAEGKGYWDIVDYLLSKSH